jgi:hypothetical protein
VSHAGLGSWSPGKLSNPLVGWTFGMTGLRLHGGGGQAIPLGHGVEVIRQCLTQKLQQHGSQDPGFTEMNHGNEVRPWHLEPSLSEAVLDPDGNLIYLHARPSAR